MATASQTSGPPTSRSGGTPRRPRLSPSRIAARNAAIARGRAAGETWRSLAARFDLTERHVREAAREHREATGSLLADTEASGVVEDSLAAADVAIERAAEHYAGIAPENINGRIGALNGQLAAIRRRNGLLADAGILDSASFAEPPATPLDALVREGVGLLAEVASGRLAPDEAADRFAALGDGSTRGAIANTTTKERRDER